MFFLCKQVWARRGLRFNVTVVVTVETTGHDLAALWIVSPRTHHTPYHIYPTYPMSPEVYIKPICLKMFTREWPGYELSPLGSTIPYTSYTHHTPCLLPKVLSAYLINPKVASLSSHQATRPPYFKSRSSGSQFSWQHLHSDNHKMNFKYIYANWQ